MFNATFGEDQRRAFGDYLELAMQSQYMMFRLFIANAMQSQYNKLNL
jgi:hypothetical protein